MDSTQAVLHLICGMLAAFLIIDLYFFEECSFIGNDTDTVKVLLFIYVSNTSIGLYYYDKFIGRDRIFIRFLFLNLAGLFLYNCIRLTAKDYKC